VRTRSGRRVERSTDRVLNHRITKRFLRFGTTMEEAEETKRTAVEEEHVKLHGKDITNFSSSPPRTFATLAPMPIPLLSLRYDAEGRLI
jgi:hypothetical protein